MSNQIKQKAIEEITQAKDLKKLEQIFRTYLGRKGKLTRVLRSLKDIPDKERKEKGKLANQVKQELSQLIENRRKELAGKGVKKPVGDWLDVTAPGIKVPRGHLHPITLVQREVEEIFQSMGYSVLDGPEVEAA